MSAGALSADEAAVWCVKNGQRDECMVPHGKDGFRKQEWKSGAEVQRGWGDRQTNIG